MGPLLWSTLRTSLNRLLLQTFPTTTLNLQMYVFFIIILFLLIIVEYEIIYWLIHFFHLSKPTSTITPFSNFLNISSFANNFSSISTITTAPGFSTFSSPSWNPYLFLSIYSTCIHSCVLAFVYYQLLLSFQLFIQFVLWDYVIHQPNTSPQSYTYYSHKFHLFIIFYTTQHMTLTVYVCFAQQMFVVFHVVLFLFYSILFLQFKFTLQFSHLWQYPNMHPLLSPQWRTSQPLMHTTHLLPW